MSNYRYLISLIFAFMFLQRELNATDPNSDPLASFGPAPSIHSPHAVSPNPTEGEDDPLFSPTPPVNSTYTSCCSVLKKIAKCTAITALTITYIGSVSAFVICMTKDKNSAHAVATALLAARI